MAIKSYKLIEWVNDRDVQGYLDGVPPGTVVYKSQKYDYGMAREDEWFTGQPHISVSLNSDGDYPFFTVPVHKLEELV